MEQLSIPGFRAAGIAAGIKKNNKKDLGLILSEVPANAAGVFTRNRVQAAPVVLTKERIKAGVCQAIIVNSGNANCCTGEQGMSDAVEMVRLTASSLGISENLILAASTGVIGQPLPMPKVQVAFPELVAALSPRGFADLAEAILTTDTVIKTVSRRGSIDGKTFTVAGVAKGAGMIRPDMATMLCFVYSDVEAAPGILKGCLIKAADRSFNRITIDGDTSTNDMAVVMANGLSGAAIERPDHIKIFQNILDEALRDLAKQLIRDGEGATKLVEVLVQGAATDSDACKIADTVANSALVKTAFFGQDANWGRIVAAVGRAGVDIDPDKIDVYFDDIQMVAAGRGRGPAVEAEATKVLQKPEFTVTIDLNLGSGSDAILTCDFSVDYVRINADYRS